MFLKTDYLLCFLFAFMCFMSIEAYGQTSVDHCDSSETPEATLTVDAAAHDGSFENTGADPHYFQIDAASDINVEITTTGIADGFLQLCDGSDDLIASSTNRIPARLRPGTYYIVVGSSGADSYRLSVATDTDYNDLLSDCGNVTTDFNDPLYGCQWHLKNTGQWIFNGQRITAGEDINTEGVWNDGISGSRVNVAVVDSGMDPLHEDLVANVNPSLNHDYSGNGNVFDPSSAHGTRVAGVIAAVGDNGIGIRGIAPQASIYNYNLVTEGNGTSANIADAMTRNHITTAVSNNSWGPDGILVLFSAGRTWELAVETGIREGFGGKGIFYVYSVGNGGDEFDQANFAEFSNYYAVTPVCSVDAFGRKSLFSEEGVNLWICAPGSLITTTDNKDRYNFGVSGTSYSAPVVSGVAALMREVNGDLSWRDLKLILAASARRNDPTDPGWKTGALKYGSDTDSYSYNPKYGFGVVDAEAAVELAENWTNVPRMRTQTASSGNINTAIPDHTGGADGEILSSLNVSDTDIFTEFVEVSINFSHAFFPDLEIQITSPGGTVSQLTEEYVEGAISYISDGLLPRNDFDYSSYTHRFGSAKHLGEDPAGEWILKIDDTEEVDTGTLHSWSIKVYGHKTVEGTAPSFDGKTITNKEYVTGRAITAEKLPEAAGGDGTLRYSITPALPTGLSFDSNTRVISGTPTTAASRTAYTYTVTDEDGDTADLTFGITVAEDEKPTFSDTIDDQKYIAGTATNLPVTLPEAAGGNAPLTYSIDPALPTGLSFNASTPPHEISGTPTTAIPETPYTWSVTDVDGDTAELTFRITIEEDSTPDLDGTTVSTQMEYTYTAGRPLTLPAATGGNPPVTYSITPDLPAGLIFNEVTRVISGTPRSASSGTYTYTVTDRNGDMDKVTFILSVEVSSSPGPTTTRRPGTSGTDAGGGGGCAVSHQRGVVPDMLGAVACLILIPVSVLVKRNRRSQIKT